jgi:hypothetical protein
MLTRYRAIYRLATAPYALSWASGGAARKQFATIGHAATVLATARLRHVWVALESASAASINAVELVRLSDNAAATGNPAITPRPFNAAHVASVMTCLALPTTPGTEGVLLGFNEWNLGITAAATVINPPPDLAWRDLLHPAGFWQEEGAGAGEASAEGFPTIRGGVAEGFAVTVDASASSTIKGFVVIDFTEEAV